MTSKLTWEMSSWLVGPPRFFEQLTAVPAVNRAATAKSTALLVAVRVITLSSSISLMKNCGPERSGQSERQGTAGLTIKLRANQRERPKRPRGAVQRSAGAPAITDSRN